MLPPPRRIQILVEITPLPGESVASAVRNWTERVPHVTALFKPVEIGDVLPEVPRHEKAEKPKTYFVQRFRQSPGVHFYFSGGVSRIAHTREDAERIIEDFGRQAMQSGCVLSPVVLDYDTDPRKSATGHAALAEVLSGWFS